MDSSVLPASQANSINASSSSEAQAGKVLCASDPGVTDHLNAHSRAPVLLVCDHASNYIPTSLDNLGLSSDLLEQHIASDMGSKELTSALVDETGCAAVLCNYSRLVIDCNRRRGDPTLISEISDEIVVPGNQNLTSTQREMRLTEIYDPYHEAVSRELDRLQSYSKAPALIAIHSFTPQMRGDEKRPWHIGVLWDKDPRIAQRLFNYLDAIDDICVGDNQPYSGKHAADFTIDHHGEDRGLPCVSIEIRQDLLNSPDGVQRWSNIIGDFIKELMTEAEVFTPLA